MAILSGTVLTDCYYIPQFIASGTKMLFENSTAPTSWTKDTTYNNSSLRVINGSVGNGGTTSFTTILTSASVVGTAATVQSGVTINPVASGVSIGIGTFGPGNTSQTVASTPVHTHSYTNTSATGRAPSGSPTSILAVFTGPTTGYQGQNLQHLHSVPATPHTHLLTNPSHTHTISESNHGHPYSSTAQNFAVSYRDVILAAKD